MGGFNIDGGRSYPHIPQIKTGTLRANGQGTDYLLDITQLAAGTLSPASFAFDTQYLAWGGVNQLLSGQLNQTFDVLLCLGRSLEVAAQITGAAGQVEFYICDYEPNPNTIAQLIANMVQDVDRPPVAVANDATTYKVIQYTVRTRYALARLRNLGAVPTTSWWLDQTMRQD